jgi:hypothetical protein
MPAHIQGAIPNNCGDTMYVVRIKYKKKDELNVKYEYHHEFDKVKAVIRRRKKYLSEGGCTDIEITYKEDDS